MPRKQGTYPANSGIELRIQPNREQRTLIAKTIGCTRKYWNIALNDREYAWQEYGICIFPTPTDYKNTEEYSYLKEIDSLALANTQLNLEKAYSNFFTNPKNYGKPTWKKKQAGGAGSYTTNNQNGTIRIENNKILLPKLGWVKIKDKRRPPKDAKIKSATVKKTAAGKYFVSVQYYYDYHEFTNDDILNNLTLDTIKGLDYSSPHFYVDDEGISPEELKEYRKLEEKLARAEHEMSRKVKGSKNYEKARIKVARIHEKIANMRRDFCHKLSAVIAKQCLLVGVEDINLRAMSNKKKHLGKATMDNGFGMFRTFLDYKLSRNCGALVKVSRTFASTQTCSCCGHRFTGEDKLRLEDRIYICPECGSVIERDINAAVNIRREALRLFFEQNDLLVRFVDKEEFEKSKYARYVRYRDGGVVLVAEQGRVFWFSNDCFDKYCFDEKIIDFCAGGMPVSWVTDVVEHDRGADPCGCLWSDCNSMMYRLDVTPAVARGGVSFESRRLVCLNDPDRVGRVVVGCCEAGRDAGGSLDSAVSHCEPAEVACSLVATEATTSIALAR